jgi:hypothetical protein
MRSKNYSNQVASFTPLEPQHMVRVALVEGMKPEYDKDERQRYRRLLKDYTTVDESRIDALFRIIKTGPRTESEGRFLDALISDVSYDSGNWKDLDYEALKKEGVIIEYSGRLKGLARLVDGIDESKVIFVPNVGGEVIDPEKEPDYLKNIKWDNKSFLNGRDVVTRFAVDNGIMLSGRYRRNGAIPVEDIESLKKGFYFTEALRTYVDGVLKQPEYLDRVITTMAIKRRDGTELRLRHLDFYEAVEFYTYCLQYNQRLIETLGNKLTKLGDKYHGANTFLVPKRIPKRTRAGGLKRHNKVKFHYMPDIKGEGPFPLDWMNTRVTCDCEHALDLENFEDRHGEMTRVVENMETHPGMVFLEMMRVKRIGLSQAVNNMSPIPTEELSVFIDKTRYNLVQEFIVMDDDKPVTKRTRAGEVNIEKLINEIAKNPEWTYERMYHQPGKVGRRFLRPMYV